MPNEILFFLSMLLNFSLVLTVYKFFNKEGLIVFFSVAVILTNIITMLTFKFFGLTTSMGDVVYGSCFLIGDILVEKFGKKVALKSTIISFVFLSVFTILVQFILLIVPTEDAQDIYESFSSIFKFMPRLCFVSLLVFGLSNICNIYLYSLLKLKTKGKFLWLRNNVATCVSQLIDTTLFTIFAFLGIYSWEAMLEIEISAIIIKVIVALCDTGFLYIAIFLIKPIRFKSKNYLDKNFNEFTSFADQMTTLNFNQSQLTDKNVVSDDVKS